MRFSAVTLFLEKCRQSVTTMLLTRQARQKAYHTPISTRKTR